MKGALRPLVAMLFLALAAGCGNSVVCVIVATVEPASATADHSAPPPGNQVQFSTVQKTNGDCVCALVITQASWTTSDPVNTSISDAGLATCLNATPSPATISYTGTECGKSFTPATLTCN